MQYSKVNIDNVNTVYLDTKCSSCIHNYSLYNYVIILVLNMYVGMLVLSCTRHFYKWVLNLAFLRGLPKMLKLIPTNKQFLEKQLAFLHKNCLE